MADSVKRYGKWALITGASAGIGLEFARQLARKGHNLVLVARDQVRLDAAADDLQKTFRIVVRTIATDLAKPGIAHVLLEQTADIDLGLAILNAGMETSGHYTKTDIGKLRDLLALNVQTPMEMAHAFGARFIEQRRGGIVFVSSLFGYQGVPLVAAYSASKAYVLALGEALSKELNKFNVDVTVLSPGLTDTAMPAAMPIDFSKLPIPKMSPKATARHGLRALGRKVSAVPGVVNRLFVWENRILPRWFPVVMFGALINYAFRKEERAKYLIEN